MSVVEVPAQPVDATQALNLSAGVSSLQDRGRCVKAFDSVARHGRLPKLLLSDFTAAVHFDLHLLAILLRGASVMQGDVGIALLLKTLLDLRLAHLS